MEGIVYRNEAEVADVVRKFESCTYRPEEFTHARHLTVASWYLATYSAEEALLRMREGLHRFLAHHGKKMGYHETITRFWLELLGDAIRRSPDRPLHERLQEVVNRFADKNVLFLYYTRELVMSNEARERWVEPDLQSICVTASVPSTIGG